MVTPIHCCYRGCESTVWASSGAGLEVRRSSATCMRCRRVALCLPHFESIFESQRDLACPNCKARQWFVRTMGGEPVSAALEVAVEASGGRVETGASVEKNRKPGPEAVWRWLRVDQLPPDAQVLGRGILARAHPRGAVVIVDGKPLDWVSTDMPTSASRASPTTSDIVVAHDSGRRLSWVGREGAQFTLYAPADGVIDRPIFIEPRRVAYVSRSTDGDEALWEASIDRADRIHQRRIAALGRGPRLDLAPVIVGRRTAVVAVASDGGVCAPTWIRLSDGQRTPLGAYGPPPRAIVGARRGRRTAWIAGDGSVRCAGVNAPLRTIGRADSTWLAMTGDGLALAWSTGDGSRIELHGCDLSSDVVQRHRIRGPLAWLGPRVA